MEISSSNGFRSWSRDQFFEVIDGQVAAAAEVVSGAMPAARLKELEVISGFNTNVSGWLADSSLRPHLDPLGIATYDWVHTMLSDGVFSTEAKLFLKAAEPFGVTRSMVQDFLKAEQWQFPAFTRSRTKNLHLIFDVRRQSASEPDRIRCTCGELLG